MKTNGLKLSPTLISPLLILPTLTCNNPLLSNIQTCPKPVLTKRDWKPYQHICCYRKRICVNSFRSESSFKWANKLLGWSRWQYSAMCDYDNVNRMRADKEEIQLHKCVTYLSCYHPVGVMSPDKILGSIKEVSDFYLISASRSSGSNRHNVFIFSLQNTVFVIKKIP
jgi:hypothetical protein